MLAVHEEKLARQEEASYELEKQIEVRRSELLNKIDDLHSRITTNTKEIMVSAREQHEKQNIEIQKLRDDVSARVGVLERWRHVLIGGSIVVGFLLHTIRYINKPIKKKAPSKRLIRPSNTKTMNNAHEHR